MGTFVCPISVENSGRAGIEWGPFRLHWGVVEASEYCPAKERDNYNNWEMRHKTSCSEISTVPGACMCWIVLTGSMVSLCCSTAVQCSLGGSGLSGLFNNIGIILVPHDKVVALAWLGITNESNESGFTGYQNIWHCII